MVAEILEKVEEKIYTIEEYIKLEEKALYKSEFRNGKIVPMVGGTRNHTRIIENVFFYLKTEINKKKYLVNGSEQSFYISSDNRLVYPDASITQKPQKFSIKNKRAAINPIIIVEVLSDSTWRYDRGEKFRRYTTLPSFTEYILIEQDTPVVDIYYRDENGWHLKSYTGLDKTIQLQSVDCQLKMAAIYEEVENLKLPQTNINF